MKHAAAITLAALLVSACGGQSDEDKIRDTAKKAVQAILSDHPERACQYVVDHDGCIGSVATARAFNLEVSAVANYPKNWRSRLEHAKVTITGDKATLGDFDGDGKPARYIRRGGEWLADNR